MESQQLSFQLSDPQSYKNIFQPNIHFKKTVHDMFLAGLKCKTWFCHYIKGK